MGFLMVTIKETNGWRRIGFENIGDDSRFPKKRGGSFMYYNNLSDPIKNILGYKEVRFIRKKEETYTLVDAIIEEIWFLLDAWEEETSFPTSPRGADSIVEELWGLLSDAEEKGLCTITV